MSESNEYKIHNPIGSLVKVVRKGETSWGIQSRFVDRPGIVIRHELADGPDEWRLNEVLFDDGEKASFYDVELVRMS